jgi:hypothetical protein
LIGLVVANVVSSQPPEPKWPLAFGLNSGEGMSVGFVVGQPGAIVVKAEWHGTALPMVVSLIKPGGASVDQQGSGGVSIPYTATAEDVKKGVLWYVKVRFAQQSPAGVAASAPVTAPVSKDTKPSAVGSIAVTHPPGEPARAQQEIAVANAQRKPPPAGATVRLELAPQRLSALRAQTVTKQGQALEQIRAKLPPAVYQELQSNISARGAGRAVAARDFVLSSAPPAVASGRAGQAAPGSQTSTTKSASTGIAGSNAPATVMASPNVTSLSLAAGQPGDLVQINGAAFSATAGEVHFIVAPGKELKAPIVDWRDAQITVTVPDASGVMPYQGMVQVVRGTAKSNLVSFKFNPEDSTATLDMTTDRFLNGAPNLDALRGNRVLYEFYFPLGGRGDDEFFKQTHLKNGWVVDSYYLTHFEYRDNKNELGSQVINLWDPLGATEGAVNVVEFSPGTDSPYLKVHWWANAWNAVQYAPHVIIKGPKGVPWF